MTYQLLLDWLCCITCFKAAAFDVNATACTQAAQGLQCQQAGCCSSITAVLRAIVRPLSGACGL
jgi:hypothetical protein